MRVRERGWWCFFQHPSFNSFLTGTVHSLGFLLRSKLAKILNESCEVKTFTSHPHLRGGGIGDERKKETGTKDRWAPSAKCFLQMVPICLLILILFPYTTHASLVNKSTTESLTNGLVGYWTFDGNSMKNNVKDMSGKGNTGYMQGFGATSTAVVAGKIGQGLKFDGADDGIDLKSSANLNFSSTNAFSISVWVNPNSIPNTSKSIFARGFVNSSALNTTYNLVTYIATGDGSRMSSRVSDGTNLITLNTSINGFLVKNQWVYITLVFNGVAKTLTLYRNGIYNDQATNASFTTLWDGDASNDRQTGIGTAFTTGSPAGVFPGYLDDVRIYNRALSASEVKKLYNLGADKINKSTLANPDLTTGLVGYWTFDGNSMKNNVADKSGSGNTGYLQNFGATSTAVVPGKIGQSLKFDGVDDYVNLGTPASLQNTGPITLSAWVYRTSGTASRGIVMYEGNVGNNVQWSMYMINKVQFAQGDGSAFFMTGNATLSLDRWYHLAAVRSGSSGNWTITLYVNGVFDKTSNTAVDPSTTSLTTMRIGSKFAGGVSYFPGSIDDVRIYNRALSASEIKQLYLLGR